MAGPKGEDVRPDPRGLRRLGRQRAGAALPRPDQALPAGGAPPSRKDSPEPAPPLLWFPPPSPPPMTMAQAEQRIRARYLIETPLEPAAVAEVMAGEQSCGTFTRVEGETDDLRGAGARRRRGHRRAGDRAAAPSLPNALARAQGPPRTVAARAGRRSPSPSATSAPTCRRWRPRSPATSSTSARSRGCGSNRCHGSRPPAAQLRAAAPGHGRHPPRSPAWRNGAMVGAIIKPQCRPERPQRPPSW